MPDEDCAEGVGGGWGKEAEGEEVGGQEDEESGGEGEDGCLVDYEGGGG